jgi:TonB family protein
MRNSLSFIATLCLGVAFCLPAFADDAQKGSESEAGRSAPVYHKNEASRGPHILDRPTPAYTEEARRNRTLGSVILSIVLCRNSKVTDIKVIQGLPYGLTESSIEAARKMTLEPAEKDGQAVSVRINTEYKFDLF